MKIQHLKVYCANLDQQKHFYTQKFKFNLIAEEQGEFTLKIGDSKLTFSEDKLKNAYYHFAFNIPNSALDKALEWTRNKVDILKYEGEEIQEFPNWKAKAIYFLDPACNIVEFIAREPIKKRFSGKFSEKTLLNISEVGLPVFQVSESFQLLNKVTGIEVFDTNQATFCACGDDEGLFIVVDSAEKVWFPTQSSAKAYALDVKVKINKKVFQVSNSSEGITVNEV